MTKNWFLLYNDLGSNQHNHGSMVLSRSIVHFNGKPKADGVNAARFITSNDVECV